MVLVQKWPFFQLFFWGSIGQKSVFYDTIKRKNAYLGCKKKKVRKSRKIDVFYKGLTHGFGPKMAIIPTFFFGYIGQKNVFYDILELKNAFLRYKNRKFKKAKKWHFSKGVNVSISPKNGHFSNFFFSANISQKNVFYDILERKNAFLRYKNRKFKKSKIWHFSKRG